MPLDYYLFIFSSFAFIAICNSKSGFILTSPKVLDAGSTEYFPLTLFDVPDNGVVTLSLRKKITDEVIAKTEISASNKYKMWIEMVVPPILDSEAILEIEGKFSGEYKIHQRKPVSIRHQSIITFVQTDKPVYKPGQTVKFRVFPLNSLLKPRDRNTRGDVWIEDPAGVRISQWKDISFKAGIIQLELPLSEEPVLGLWSIKTIINNIPHSQTFSVEKYVLPKFEVIITPPSYIMADAHAIIAEICAHYTYGKKVDGLLKATMTFNRYPWEKDENTKMPSVDHEGKISGCHPFIVQSADLLLHKKKFGYRDIIISAEITENGTEITQNCSTVMKITHTPLEMTFLGVENGNRYFKPGLPFHEKLRVSKPDGKPATFEKIEICATLTGNIKVPFKLMCRNFTTDKQGEISFIIPAEIPDFYKIELEATAKRYLEQPYDTWGIKIHQPHTKVVLRAWYSPTGSLLQIEPITNEVQCEKLEQVKIRYTTKNGSTVNFYHQVISRGRIVQQGSHHRTFYFTGNGQQDLNDPLTLQLVKEELRNPELQGFDIGQTNPPITMPPHVGEFILSFDSRATMSPIARLLVFYVQPDGEVVADVREFHITHCLPNKARLNFRHEQQYPSTEATILLSASPSSLCGIGLVDKSVHLMHPDKQINKQKIFKLMESYDISASTQPTQTSEEHCKNSASLGFYYPEELEPHGYYYRYMHRTHHVDAITAFEDAGMVVMSDFTLETRPCRLQRLPHLSHFAYNARAGVSQPVSLLVPVQMNSFAQPVAVPHVNEMQVEKKNSHESPKSVAEIRSYFPETWLWELHSIGESGEMAFNRKLPDTVTEWVGSAICVHPETGLGISDYARITAFQPFFVAFSLPYSVIRDEIVPVVITVFNYLSECLPIKLSLEPTEAYKIVRESRIHKLCICGGKSKAHKFYIRPVVLGHVNITVYGFSLEEDIICENEITARLSARDAVTRQLLVEAEGFAEEEIFNSFFCPHQSNGLFSTEVDLLLPENVVEGSARAYVSVTGDLMGPALNNMNELVRLPMGCGEQNMVLFAPNIFVLDYLSVTGRITEEIKTKALNYMQTGYQRELRYRHPDGSYSAFGENDDEGSMWLTAFVVRSFSQARRFIPIDENDLALSTTWIVSKQFENGCFYPVGTVLHSGMKGGLGDGDQSLAPLTAYVLMALLEAGFSNEKVVSSAIYCLRAEMNPTEYSLALFAYATALAKDTVAQDYLERLESLAVIEGNLMYWKYGKIMSKSIDIEISAYAILAMLEVGGLSNVPKVLPVVRWITKQRNANGGFVSTQDTVVALQALAKYASFNTEAQVNVGITIESDELMHSFTVNEANKLTTQSVKFPVVPTVVDFQATGEGCALAQFTVRYNVETIPGSEAFDLRVAASRTGISDCSEASIGICMRYKVQHKKSNMIVLTVKMVSGYVPDEESLLNLQKDKKLELKRHDTIGNLVHFYFYELTQEQKCIQFLVKNELEVENAKPATVKLYDYYQTEWEVTENYEIPSECTPSTDLPPLPDLPPLETDESEENSTILDTTLSTNANPTSSEYFTSNEFAIENVTESLSETTTLLNSFHLEPILENSSVIMPKSESEIFGAHDVFTTTYTATSTDEILEKSEDSQTQVEDRPLSDDQSQVLSSFDQFVVVDHDLDTPDGLEGNEPVTVLPPEDLFFTKHEEVTEPPPDCPACYTDFPENFTDIYCSAAFALRVTIRDENTGIVKIIHDVSSFFEQPRAVKEFGVLTYDARCTCRILKQKENLVWILGTSADLWRMKSSKHSLTLNSDVTIISASRKAVQPPQVKKARSECNGVP